MYSVDYVVVGGGIVGLGIGAVLSRFGSTLILERHNRLISETSSRNSGVVHAGIYYPHSSLKTKLCMEGNANIWRLVETQSTPIMARRIGKWIGSCDVSEEGILQQLVENMKARGIPYEMVSKEQQLKFEPLVVMKTVLNSLSSGIIDVESLKNFFLRTLDNSNTDSTVSLNTEVKAIHLPWESGSDYPMRDAIRIVTRDTDLKGEDVDSFVLHAQRAVVCAAGLEMPELWRHLYGDGGRPLEAPEHHTMYFCRGRYAMYHGKQLVSRLVYPCPLPELVGLGVHSVVDMAGNVRFGPDAVYVNSPDDYSFGDSEEEIVSFLDNQWASVRRYLPSIERKQLFVDYTGIRTKLSGKGMPFRDFLFEEVGSDGLTTPLSEDGGQSKARLVILNGIESPGLTACTAIADFVAKSIVGSRKFNLSPSPWSL